MQGDGRGTAVGILWPVGEAIKQLGFAGVIPRIGGLSFESGGGSRCLKTLRIGMDEIDDRR